MSTDARDGLAVVELNLDHVSAVRHRAPAQQAITLTTKVRKGTRLIRQTYARIMFIQQSLFTLHNEKSGDSGVICDRRVPARVKGKVRAQN